MPKIEDEKAPNGPVGFRPINDDHAVNNVVFSLSFDQGIVPDDITNFVAIQPNIEAELPSVRGNNTDDEFGVTFSYLRPNGSAIWIARFADHKIDVECTRYTRWDKIAAQALSYINAACKVVLEREKEATFSLVKLRFIDKFVHHGPDYDLSSLLNRSNLISQQIFDSGASWHSETGWFEEYNSDLQILNRVNVAAILEESDVYDQRAIVKVDHFQETRRKSWNGEEILDNINDLFDTLHQGNKKVVTDLLSSGMQEQISLWRKND